MKSELVEIGKILAAQKGRAMVLGSTPEYRDLALGLGYETTALDINPNMLSGMEELMTQSAGSHNKKVVGDWNAMPFPDASFEYILAEQSLNIVPMVERGSILSECARVLTPGGIFFCKVMVIRSDFRQTVTACTEKFLKAESTLNDYTMCLMHATDSDGYDETTGMLRFQDRAFIEQYVADGALSPAVQRDHRRVYAADYTDHHLYLLSEETTEQQLEARFTVDRIIRGIEFEMSKSYADLCMQKEMMCQSSLRKKCVNGMIFPSRAGTHASHEIRKAAMIWQPQTGNPPKLSSGNTCQRRLGRGRARSRGLKICH